jgi:5-methylthioadenosine/S-adenosylhomocysteine deaminase
VALPSTESSCSAIHRSTNPQLLPRPKSSYSDSLTPGKQADVIMVRTDGVGVFPLSNAIGTVVQAVERADVDTVMVAGQIRKRAGKLVDIGLDKLRTEVEASRDYLLQVSDQPADLFAAKVAYKG